MLANPKEHVQQVTMLFERLVETTLGVTKEEMSQPVFAGLDCLTFPELHDVRTWHVFDVAVAVAAAAVVVFVVAAVNGATSEVQAGPWGS